MKAKKAIEILNNWKNSPDVINVVGTTYGEKVIAKALSALEHEQGFEARKAFYDRMRESQEFEALARPLIKYLNENHHPHTTIIITPTNAEVLEGIKSFHTVEYIKD
jgi:arsenate reductase-like glutaredoxin family protein